MSITGLPGARGPREWTKRECMAYVDRPDRPSKRSHVTDLESVLPVLLDRAETAKVLRMSERSVDRRIKEGALKATRVGARILVPRGAIVEMLLLGRTGAHAPRVALDDPREAAMEGNPREYAKVVEWLARFAKPGVPFSMLADEVERGDALDAGYLVEDSAVGLTAYLYQRMCLTVAHDVVEVRLLKAGLVECPACQLPVPADQMSEFEGEPSCLGCLAAADDAIGEGRDDAGGAR